MTSLHIDRITAHQAYIRFQALCKGVGSLNIPLIPRTTGQCHRLPIFQMRSLSPRKVTRPVSDSAWIGSQASDPKVQVPHYSVMLHSAQGFFMWAPGILEEPWVNAGASVWEWAKQQLLLMSAVSTLSAC